MGSPVNRGQLMKPAEIKSAILRKYQFIKCVSSGVYGQVVKCLKKDTQEVVTIKLPYFKQDTKEEIRVLRNLMDRGVDQKHIVKFFGAFKTPFGKGMIFEMLEMSVEKYQYQHFPLPISDVRTIIKQVAIGLEVLKDMSIMHGDLHAGNVMVSHRNPLHVKITDFGMAMSTTKVKQGMEIRLRESSSMTPATMDQEEDNMSTMVDVSEPQEQVDAIQMPITLPQSIMVQPASPENTSPWTEGDRVREGVQSTMEATLDIKKETKMWELRVRLTAWECLGLLDKGNLQYEKPKKQKKLRWRWNRRVAPMLTEEPTASSTGPKKKNWFQRILSWFTCTDCSTVVE